jgi:hypothetical protein
VASAFALIDAFLTDTKSQSLIDADRVRDLLLDLRSAIDEDLFDAAVAARG